MNDSLRTVLVVLALMFSNLVTHIVTSNYRPHKEADPKVVKTISEILARYERVSNENRIERETAKALASSEGSAK